MTAFLLCLMSHLRSHAGLAHSTLADGFQPSGAYHRAPPLLFRRRPPQSNYPPQRVPDPVSWIEVRHQKTTGWYFTYGSTTAGAVALKPPTYATQFFPNATLKLQSKIGRAHV